MTPAKREFSYPKALAATSPHDRIIKRFWAAHNDTSLDLSMSLSVRVNSHISSSRKTKLFRIRVTKPLL